MTGCVIAVQIAIGALLSAMLGIRVQQYTGHSVFGGLTFGVVMSLWLAGTTALILKRIDPRSALRDKPEQLLRLATSSSPDVVIRVLLAYLPGTDFHLEDIDLGANRLILGDRFSPYASAQRLYPIYVTPCGGGSLVEVGGLNLNRLLGVPIDRLCHRLLLVVQAALLAGGHTAGVQSQRITEPSVRTGDQS